MVKLIFRISGAQPAPGLDPGLCSLCCDPESLDDAGDLTVTFLPFFIGEKSMIFFKLSMAIWMEKIRWTIKFGVAYTASSWDWLWGTAGTAQNNLHGVRNQSKLLPVLGLLNSGGLNRGSTKQHTSTMYWEQCTEYWYKYFGGGERFSERFSEWDPSER